MPCRGEEVSAAWWAEQRQRDTDKFTRMLCGICRRVERLAAEGNIVSMDDVTQLIEKDDDLAKWWASHKKLDAKREAERKAKKRKQQLRRSALKKLTAEELEALGIK